MKALLLAVAALSFTGLSHAAEPVPKDAEQLPEAPPAMPAGMTADESFEPEVTIVKEEERTLFEYRINGQIYMVRVQPNAGPAYYLLDTDGDGELDAREDDPRNIAVPQWVLFRW